MHHLETVTGDGRAPVTVLYTMTHPDFPVLQAVMLGTTDIFDALTCDQVEALTDECITAHDAVIAAEFANFQIDMHPESHA